MYKHTGLTVVPHEDLKRAVDNWSALDTMYKDKITKAAEYAREKYYNSPLHKRIWWKAKAGIFIPQEYWDFYSEYLDSVPKIKGSGVGKRWLPSYCYTNKAMAAEDCHKHSLENGTHYLDALQVQFVNTFKDIEVGYE